MTNFNQRLITSLFLFIVVFFSLSNNYVLLITLAIVGWLSFFEIYNLSTKIFLSKNKIFFILLISFIYLIFFSIIIFSFLTPEITAYKLIFIYFLLTCIFTDLGGYCFGKVFKGKKLTKISPNKTYSGVLGSYFFTIVLYIFFLINFNFETFYLYLAILISSMSQLGDLFFSYLKRKANVKDTGNFLPGHGGILDRIDGIIFAVPFAICLTKILN